MNGYQKINLKAAQRMSKLRYKQIFNGPTYDVSLSEMKSYMQNEGFTMRKPLLELKSFGDRLNRSVL